MEGYIYSRTTTWLIYSQIHSRMNVQAGWPRSGWPQVGHFDQKIKVNQIASYCAMLYPRCCSLWPSTFWGLHSFAFDSSAGQTRGSHFNFYWGTDITMWSYVHFLCSCVSKIDFYHLLWNWQVKRLIKQQKTRQIWGIWKLRPAYSPETPNLGQNLWCFVPCDLEIWWMTLENNRASLLCCFKLCATFHSHRWIQTGNLTDDLEKQ